MNLKWRFIPDLALVLSRFKFFNLTPLVDCQSLDPIQQVKPKPYLLRK